MNDPFRPLGTHPSDDFDFHQNDDDINKQVDSKNETSPLNPNANPFVPKFPISIATLNARSLQSKPKRQDIINTLMNQHEILAITETWLPYYIGQEFPTLNVLQSDLGKHRQVAIVARDYLHLVPVFQDLWSDCLMAVRVEQASAKKPLPPFFLIAVYWPPGKAEEQASFLSALVERNRNRNNEMQQIITGDFNLSVKKMTKIAQKHNLHLAQDALTTLPTHHTSANNRFNQLDYILTTAEYRNPHCTQDNRWSDHNVLSADILLPPIQQGGNKNHRRYVDRLKQNMSIEEEAKVLSHPEWPRRSFLQVAKVLGLTKRLRITNGVDGGKICRTIKQKIQLQRTLEATNIVLEEYYHQPGHLQEANQEETMRRLMELWQKGPARLYLTCLTSSTAPLQQRILEQFRCKLPRHFFQAMKQTLKLHNKATICRQFKSQVVNGQIKESGSIQGYLEDLYRSKEEFRIQEQRGTEETLKTNPNEVAEAIRKLHRRATGVDGLSMEVLKRPEHAELLAEKLAQSSNRWFKNQRLPDYLKRGKLLILSKEETPYPTYGAIRSISMGTALTKIIETVILNRLKQEVSAKHLVHQNQRGFQEGKNTLQNIAQLAELIQQTKAVQRQYRQQKIPVQIRKRSYIFFIDLKRAFDSVDKNSLLSKLEKIGISAPLTNAIRAVIDNNSLQLDEQVIRTKIGVPQGSKLSPLLFVLYINGLIENLNSAGNQCLAFADDIVVVSQSKHALAQAVQTLEEWSLETNIRPNPEKSAIMVIREDGRTPPPKYKRLMGYPVKTSYKYLGVEIADTLQMRLHKQKLKHTAQAFSIAIKQRQAAKLPLLAKFQAWTALFLSKAQYASWYLSTISKQVEQQMRRLYYQGMKTLFGIRQQPQVEALYRATTGISSNELIKYQQQRSLTLISQSAPPPKGKDVAMQNLKQAIKLGASALVKVLAKCMYPRSNKQTQLRVCPCGTIMSQPHLFSCPRLEKWWMSSAKKVKLRSGRNLKLQLGKDPQKLHKSKQIFAMLAEGTRILSSDLQKILKQPNQANQALQQPKPPRKATHKKLEKQRPQIRSKPQYVQTSLYDYFRPRAKGAPTD